MEEGASMWPDHPAIHMCNRPQRESCMGVRIVADWMEGSDLKFFIHVPSSNTFDPLHKSNSYELPRCLT